VPLSKKNPTFRRILLFSSSASSSVNGLFDHEVKAIWSSETLVALYQLAQHTYPEKLNLQQHRCKNRKLPIISISYKLRRLETNERPLRGSRRGWILIRGFFRYLINDCQGWGWRNLNLFPQISKFLSFIPGFTLHIPTRCISTEHSSTAPAYQENANLRLKICIFICGDTKLTISITLR